MRRYALATLVIRMPACRAAILFPWLATKVQLPAKMSADHKTLVEAMERCSALVAGLRHDAPAQAAAQAVALLVQEFASMRSETEGHFAEEEEVGLPLLRYHFK